MAKSITMINYFLAMEIQFVYCVSDPLMDCESDCIKLNKNCKKMGEKRRMQKKHK